MTLPSTLAEARVVRIGTLTFRVYNESRDKQHVNIEITADGNDSAGNIDCSLREWHGLQDLANADSLRAALAAAERERDEARNIAKVAEREAIAHREARSHAEHRLALIGERAHIYGAALKPRGADTYGEGMRDAKEQVARILGGTTSV